VRRGRRHDGAEGERPYGDGTESKTEHRRPETIGTKHVSRSVLWSGPKGRQGFRGRFTKRGRIPI
jgi:hypothetical protein